MILLFGEFHGTRELPAFFGEAVCGLHSRFEVVVGLELPGSEREAIEKFLSSADTGADRRALSSGEFWNRAYQDGRSGAAMVGLLDRLRQLKRTGRPISLVLFDAPPDGARDEHMAARISEAAKAHPQAVIAVLTGNLHARTRPGVPWDPTWKPMGWFLRRHRKVHSFDLAGPAGEYWGCLTAAASGCGVQQFEPDQPSRATSGISLHPRLSPEGFTGVYSVDSLTASGPAVAPAAAR